MFSMIILAIYCAIGVVAAVVLSIRRKGSSSFVLMIVLWPFLLPTRLLAEPTRAALPSSARRRRIAEVSASVSNAWTESRPTDPRERAVVEAFLTRLEQQAARLEDLKAAIDRAAPSIRARLETLHAECDREIEEGLALLEEMVAQLTLLRFTGVHETAGVDRDLVEGLLARIEAMANISPEPS